MRKIVICLIISLLILVAVAIAGIITTTNNNIATKNANAVTANFTIIDADYYPPQNNKAIIEISSPQPFIAYAKENNITTIYRGNIFRSYIFHPVYWYPLNTTIICTELTR